MATLLVSLAMYGEAYAGQEDPGLFIEQWNSPSIDVLDENGNPIGVVEQAQDSLGSTRVVALAYGDPERGFRQAPLLGFMRQGEVVYVNYNDVITSGGLSSGQLAGTILSGRAGALIGGFGPNRGVRGGRATQQVVDALSNRFRLPVCPGDPRCTNLIAPPDPD